MAVNDLPATRARDGPVAVDNKMAPTVDSTRQDSRRSLMVWASPLPCASRRNRTLLPSLRRQVTAAYVMIRQRGDCCQVSVHPCEGSKPSQGSDSRTEAVSKPAGQSTAAAELGLGDPGWATCTIAHARGD